jgi:KDO2-lipid IV(A) lauroyltransferase
LKNAPLRHAVEAAALWPFYGLLRALPHGASRRIGAALGALAGQVDRRRRRTAFDNLALALPELPLEERKRIVGACFRHFGASFCDALSSLRYSAVEIHDRVQRVGFENFALAAEDGKGFIILGSHFGNWEIVPAMAALEIGSVAVVGRRADNPHFDRLVRKVRTRFGNVALDKRGSVREMFRVIERGGRLGLLIDQRVRAAEAIEVPFFGQPALTSPIVARLAQRTGAAVVPVFGEELPGGRYRVEALPPMRPLAGEDDVALTRRYLETLETRVRERPELWLWLHRRWKR